MKIFNIYLKHRLLKKSEDFFSFNRKIIVPVEREGPSELLIRQILFTLYINLYTHMFLSNRIQNSIFRDVIHVIYLCFVYFQETLYCHSTP